METEPTARRLDAVVALLERHEQQHLLIGLDRNNESLVSSFVAQVEAIDLDELAQLSDPGNDHDAVDEGSIEPAPVVARHPDLSLIHI